MQHQRYDPGTQWLVNLYGERWPCVVFKSDKLLEAFRNLRKSIDAVPVFVLARESLAWCSPGVLEEYPQEYVNNPSGKDEELRRRAFDEAAHWYPLSHWEDRMMAKQFNIAEKRKAQAAKAQAAKLQNVKRDSQPDVSVRKSPVADNADIGKPISSASNGMKGKSSIQSPLGPTKSDAKMQYAKSKSYPDVAVRRGSVEDEMDIDRPISRPSIGFKDKPSMQSPLGPAKSGFVLQKRSIIADPTMSPNKRTKPIYDPLSGSSGGAEARKAGFSRAEESEDDLWYSGFFKRNPVKKNAVEVNPGSPLTPEEQAASQKKVIVYLGEGSDESIFETNMHIINELTYFKRHLTIPVAEEGTAADNPENEDAAKDDDSVAAIVQDLTPYVRTPDLASITMEDFAPIGQFLTTKDYTPILAPGPPPHLLGIKSIKQHEEQALKAGGIWNHAKTFEMTSLMHLIYRKIQAQWPLENDTLLMFTQLVYFDDDAGFKIEARMKETLKEEMASRFFELMHQDALLLSRLMRANEDICIHIARQLVEDPRNAGRYGVEDD